MFDLFKKSAPIYLRLEYPFMISVLLFGIALESFVVVRPELKYIVDPASTLLLFAILAARTPFSSRRLSEALKNA